jgi:hypothetical protein
MPTATSVLTAFAGIVAAISIAIYFFGIPPELKRKMEKQALKTMGENKASYLVKGQYSLDVSKLSNFLTSIQTKSVRCQLLTRKMLRTSRKALATSLVED